MPVLPPTAASTMPSSVVGTWTTRTPRSQVAATKPPRSVVAPPPKVTTASERVNPASPSASQQSAATAAVLASSPSGSPSASTSYDGRSTSSTGAGQLGQPGGVEQRHPLHALAEERRAAGRPARGPTTTSYGEAPPHVQHGGPGHAEASQRRLRVISAATSSGVRPSVSTTTVATDS